ncbi:MAG: hypothetical protein H6993_12015 [Pseudomonadales bacterium]|nr:hypothetical protein [Pseudomonadales bacterium]MCP5184682.1 hypothetical protein [Pseudomonadales bacterium]
MHVAIAGLGMLLLAPAPLELGCTATGTAGFHDFPGAPERYEPVVFNPGRFTLLDNPVFNAELAPAAGERYLTMIMEGVVTELTCRRVRDVAGESGLSCENSPPSELLVLNDTSLRFTRASVGGWTFRGAQTSTDGSSIYVEFGGCEPVPARP